MAFRQGHGGLEYTLGFPGPRLALVPSCGGGTADSLGSPKLGVAGCGLAQRGPPYGGGGWGGVGGGCGEREETIPGSPVATGMTSPSLGFMLWVRVRRAGL